MKSKCLSAKQLESFLYPKSLAVVGASRTKGKVGHIVLQNILSGGYQGKVVGVNPKAKTILEVDIFARYDVLPFVPDMALVALPADLALETLELIGKHGTRNVVLYSAGFKEEGQEGKKREKKLKRLIDEFALNILGPNCLGFVNEQIALNATFGDVTHTKGNIRFVSQSGAIATSLYDVAHEQGLGFEQFITLGNKSDLHEADFLRYFAADKKLKRERKANFSQGLSPYYPVGMYLESIEDGTQYLEAIEMISKTDPVLVLKPGRNKGAQKAMQSHTGAMASDDAVLEEALAHAGAIRCEGVEDMNDLLKAFSYEVAPEGPNVAVVSNAGGPGVITADWIEQCGLQLANIPKATKAKMMKHLPRAASVVNPVDVLGDALSDRYAKALELCLKLKGVDAALVILTPQVMTQIKETARAIQKVSSAYGKPIVCAFMGGSLIQAGEVVLSAAKIPNFRHPERAVKVLAQMYQWRNNQKHRKRTSSLRNTIPNQQIHWIQDALQIHATGALSSLEADEIIKWAGIKSPHTKMVTSFDQAKQFATQVGYPVVLKMSSCEVLHKKDVGGVIANIENENALKTSYAVMKKRLQMLKKKDTKIQIQSQIPGGVEVIVGIKRDPSFGPVLMIGAGGTFAELIEDKELILLPAGKKQILQRLKQTKIMKILEGYRGDEGYDVHALVSMIAQLAELAVRVPSIGEIEINPIIVNRKHAWAVDAKIIKAL